MSTTITIAAHGTHESALKTGEYWAKRFDVQRRPFAVTAERISNSVKWKVTIKYQNKETCA